MLNLTIANVVHLCQLMNYLYISILWKLIVLRLLMKQSLTITYGSSQKTEDVTYNKFLSPPVSICISCDKALTIWNNPSKAKLFTLECRECAHVYGVCNYTNKSGTRFYQHDVGIIEISDVSYMDPLLYQYFPALRCVIFQFSLQILCSSLSK